VTEIDAREAAIPSVDSWRRYLSPDEDATEVTYQADLRGVILAITPAVHALLGWTPEELIGTSARDLFHPSEQERVAELRDTFYGENQEFQRVTCLLRTASGGYRSMTLSARPLLDDEGTAIGAVVHASDTHERDAAVRALTTLSQANRTLTRATDENVLLQSMCQTVVDSGTYLFAWYGRPVDDPEQTVQRVASAGEHRGYLDEISISWGDNPLGHGPTGRAIRTGQTQVANDLGPDESFSPWREAATSRGIHSSITLPVLVDGTLDGVFMVYAAETGAFDAHAQDLLEDLAADLGYGLHRLRVIAERDAAARLLAESETRFRLLAQNSSDVIMLSRPDMTLTWVSPSVRGAFGLAPEDIVGANAASLIHPDDLPMVVAEAVRTDADRSVLHLRHRALHADGHYFWVDVLGGHVEDDGTGSPGRVVAIRDIDAEVRAEQELAAREMRYRLLADNSSDVILLSSSDMTVQWASPSSLPSFGYPPEQLIGTTPAFLVHPEDLAAIAAAAQQSLIDDTVVRTRHRVVRSDGTIVWVDSVSSRVRDDSIGDSGWIVSLRDIDAQVRAEQELSAREEQYRMLAENASDVVWQTDREGRVVWVSPSVTPVLGWEPAELLGRTGVELIHPGDVERTRVERDETRGERALQTQFRVLTKDGGARWMSVAIRSVGPDTSQGRVVTMRDIEDEVLARERLVHALGHDQATGLPNRQVMLDRLLVTREQLRPFHAVAVLTIGVDGLSEVNEALTYASGDLLLTTVAARIASALPTPDGVGRGAGNELLVIVPQLRSGADASRTAEAIMAASRGRVTISGQSVSPSVSIGIATGGKEADPEQLLRDSSLALRKAKDNGRDRFEFADPGLIIEAQQRLALDAEIRAGLEAGQFVPWFQPIVELTHREVVGYEALARWIRTSGPTLPIAFLPIAERSSLIIDIDLAIMRQSISALATLPEQFFVSVNVSTATLARTAYADHVMSALLLSDVHPSRLHIEVTETMLLDPTDATTHAIRTLAELGARWYIDDFGTGYASITSMRDLPMSGLKLDRSFTFGVTSRERTSMQLAQALVGLADGLDLDTVVEGVEMEDQARYLSSLGWKHAQGWLFGKAEPLPSA